MRGDKCDVVDKLFACAERTRVGRRVWWKSLEWTETQLATGRREKKIGQDRTGQDRTGQDRTGTHLEDPADAEERGEAAVDHAVGRARVAAGRVRVVVALERGEARLDLRVDDARAAPREQACLRPAHHVTSHSEARPTVKHEARPSQYAVRST